MRLALFIPLLWLFVGCSNDVPSGVVAPTNLIPEDKMVDIVADLNLIESQMSEVRLVGVLNKDSTEKYYNQLYSKYGIDKSQFSSSLDYYAYQVNALDSIYNNALKKLAEMDEELSDVEYVEEKLTYIDRLVFVEILKKDSLIQYFNDSASLLPTRDSVLVYCRQNPSILDTISLRKFYYNMSFHCSNENKFKSIKEMVLKPAN